MAGWWDIFSNQDAQNAANAQIQGINQGYGDLSQLFGQGRDYLTKNYMAGVQPFLTEFGEGQAGIQARADALGLNGPEGNKRATAAFWNNPAIQSQLDIGRQNVLRGAEAAGTPASGGTLADLDKYAQQIASGGWQNYVSSLDPYLNFSQGAASGIGGLYSGLGNQLNANVMGQGNAAYGAATSRGNAQANADLANYNASANKWGALLGGLGAITSMGGWGGGGGGLGYGGKLFGMFQ